ncbi:hypothetical protein VPH35_059613 [Triticum aestivum]
MWMEPASRCASKLSGHQDADGAPVPPSYSESRSAAKLQPEPPRRWSRAFSPVRVQWGKGNESNELVDGTKTSSQPCGDLCVISATRVYRCAECVWFLSQWHSCEFILVLICSIVMICDVLSD